MSTGLTASEFAARGAAKGGTKGGVVCKNPTGRGGVSIKGQVRIKYDGKAYDCGYPEQPARMANLARILRHRLQGAAHGEERLRVNLNFPDQVVEYGM